MRNEPISTRLTKIEPKCHIYLYYFKRGVKCIECGRIIKYIFHVCKKDRKSPCNEWICMTDENRENDKKFNYSIIRKNWEKYSSQGQLYEHTDTAYRQAHDIIYFDELYRKSTKLNIDIDTIINTFKPRTLNEDTSMWNPVID